MEIIKKLQRLIYRNPWAVQDAMDYWKNPPDNNKPDNYARKFHGYTKALGDAIEEHTTGVNTVLELGCNVGRNLEYLSMNGFHTAGVEINTEAIELMKKIYPALYAESTIYTGSIEEVLPTIKENSYDLVFTVAVLYHIHFSSDYIFKMMVNVASKYIITMEAEYAMTDPLHFPRDYKKIFEKLGMKQVASKKYNEVLTIRVFKKMEE